MPAKTAKFALGQVVATPGALSAIDPITMLVSLGRHAAGDWGDIDPEDAEQNELAVQHEWAAMDTWQGGRVMSVYKLDPAAVIWIITEWDRSVTTVLLPSEY